MPGAPPRIPDVQRFLILLRLLAPRDHLLRYGFISSSFGDDHSDPRIANHLRLVRNVAIFSMAMTGALKEDPWDLSACTKIEGLDFETRL